MLTIALFALSNLALLAFIALVWAWPLPVGTRSLLWGAHQVVLHPLFLAVAWVRLYGVPPLRDWLPLAVAFVVHDWGYWGRPNMDGPEGQRHPELGGAIMTRMFSPEWGDFTRFHSRSYATLAGGPPSLLAAADKLVLIVTPQWLYLPLVRLSGEVEEYTALYARWKQVEHVTVEEWYSGLREHWLQETCRLAPSTEFARRHRAPEGASYAAERAASRGGQ